ncbi:CHASE domain-containing protein [Okeania sp.]|uniref:CHASE domain-containing protein n=1 Tax=Okeania sp. TaxID=3100323 RepID=UPI002B4B37BF|nr:CHASE domain-containing protein [Okeania sp.]MEB3340821.1 CHASE domain-containing protein [Okeania sp.]
MNTNKYEQAKNNLFRQYLPVWLTIIIGILLSGIGFTVVRNWESKKISIEFQSLALDKVDYIEDKIREEINVLLSLKSFYESSQEVNREEFKQFVSSFLARMPSIQALEWIPYVTAGEREKYELMAQKDGYSNFQFTQHNEAGKIVRANLKAEYFPVYFVEPYQGNEKALGFDLSSNSNRLAALEKARDTGEAIATAKIKLVEKTENTNGFLIFQPIYQKQSINNSIADFRQNLQGFVVGVFSIENLFENYLDNFSTEGEQFDIYIYDTSASTESEKFLYFSSSKKGDNYSNNITEVDALAKLKLATNDLGRNFIKTVKVGEREWLFLLIPNQKYIKNKESWDGWLFLSLGLCLTAGISSYLNTNINQTKKIKKLVAERTQELFKTNQELEKARDDALAATRAKSDFIATMSHEIRTPMNGVIGMTSLLLNTELSERQKDFVETIRTSGDSLLTIINDILDFSKIDSGKLELEYQPVLISSCIEEVLDLLYPVAQKKGLEVAYYISPVTPKCIITDVTRLRQILTNLLNNAIKFTDVGEVILQVNAEDISQKNNQLKNSEKCDLVYQIEFSVRDTGIGIAKDKQQILFQSFTQVDASTTRKYGGTGLGLVISKRLSEMMGGKIWLDSELGKGSTFYFTIKAKVGVIPTNINLIPGEAKFDDKQILIVDDNATNRKILHLQTQSWGVEPHSVGSGSEALQLLQQENPFSLAILDLQMPEIDGLQLAGEIRKLRKCQDLPLILLSSSGLPLTSDLLAQINFAATLQKPIKSSQLYQVLLAIFQKQPIKLTTKTSKDKNTEIPQLAEELPLQILLAEDNRVNQKVAINILKRLGYLADVAANGLEVLEALKLRKYDIILMDMQMPEMDGLEATKKICQQFLPTEIPYIIAVTANAMETDKQLCFDAGMNDYLSKPIQIQELIKVLRIYQAIRYT